MRMFWARVVEFVEKVEARILQWMRLLTVVVVTLTLFAGAVTFLISAAMVSTSTDVSMGPIELPEFVEPILNDGNDDESREGPLDNVYRQYEDSIEDVVEDLHPLAEAVVGWSKEKTTVYTTEVIKTLQDNIEDGLGALDDDDVESRTEDAVDGMVDYAEDLADYYVDEIDLDTSDDVAKVGKKLEPAFERLLRDVMLGSDVPGTHLELRGRVRHGPLRHYVVYYLLTAEKGLQAARREAEEGEETVKAGLAGFAFLLPVGGVLVLLLFLLLLFKIEIRLRDDAPAAAAEKEQTPAEISGPTPEEGRP